METGAIKAVARVLNGILDAINRKAKRDNPADSLSGNGRVQQSESTFDDLASKPERDRTE